MNLVLKKYAFQLPIRTYNLERSYENHSHFFFFK